jgi:hypothetical protein
MAQRTIRRVIDKSVTDSYAPYLQNGLVYVSNNPNIHTRDSAGNIIVNTQDESSLLIVEPVTFKVTTESVLRILKTSFQYYKFPVQEVLPVSDVNLNVDLNIDTQIDNVYARYRPSERRRILTSNSGILMDVVEDGNLQREANRYYITKEIKNSGVDLRFRIRLMHRFDSNTNEFGTSYFYIYKEGTNTLLNREFLGPFFNTSNSQTNTPGSIGQYEVQSLEVDFILQNSQIEIGDTFSIGAVAGQNNDQQFHTIEAVQSYWVITDASKNVDIWNQLIS